MSSTKTKRRNKLVLADLENMLAKYDRRIQKLAEQAYRVRRAIDSVTVQNHKSQQGTIKEETNAIRETGRTDAAGESNQSNTNGGESQLLDNNAPKTVLDQQ